MPTRTLLGKIVAELAGFIITKLYFVPLQQLMCSPDSAVADFYPSKFECDLNGKQQDWEAVVLIPFIAEVKFILGYFWSLNQFDFNWFGKMFLFKFSTT